jgi:hypothetical protein
MKTIWNKLTWLFIVIVVVPFSSCEKDESTTSDGQANYIMSLRTTGANDESSDYLLTVKDLMSGEISAQGNGVELVGWNYTGKFGNTFFSFGYDLNECIGYNLTNNELQEKGKFVFDRFDVINPIDNSVFMAIGAPWGGGSFNCQLQVVDIDDISISKKVLHPIYVSYDPNNPEVQLNAWPTNSYVDGDKLFVSFYTLNGVSWETPNTDTAYVSVFSYPELDYLKTMKDARTGPIGYYGAQPCILEDEMGDHYTLSSGAYTAGFTQITKGSAILKIPSGTDEFDADYFFDFEATGYRVTSAVYVANGLAVANVISKSIDEAASADSQWGLFSEVTPLLNTAVIDLYNKTLTIVDDVPLHGGQYQTPFLVEDGKTYISVNNGLETYVYQVDAVNASATKGAKLIGNQFQGLYSVN